jgi:predicted RNase H-like nuclease
MPSPAESAWVAGVDGCQAGWAVVFRRGDGSGEAVFALLPDFAAVLADPRRPAVIALDMPIGLPDHVGPGGRGPERAVRPLLGERQSSVFSVPSRAAVMEEDYRRACAVALATSGPPKMVSKQCFHLFPRIREVDRLMTPALEARVYEAHPELGFWRLNGERPMALPKKVKGRPSPPGLAERAALLADHGYDPAFLDQPLPRGVGRDDLVDAAVLALTAARIARGEGRSFPSAPERDGRGLRMAIWA